jgi:hypothetical protein
MATIKPNPHSSAAPPSAVTQDAAALPILSPFRVALRAAGPRHPRTLGK